MSLTGLLPLLVAARTQRRAVQRSNAVVSIWCSATFGSDGFGLAGVERAPGTALRMRGCVEGANVPPGGNSTSKFTPIHTANCLSCFPLPMSHTQCKVLFLPFLPSSKVLQRGQAHCKPYLLKLFLHEATVLWKAIASAHSRHAILLSVVTAERSMYSKAACDCALTYLHGVSPHPIDPDCKHLQMHQRLHNLLQ